MPLPFRPRTVNAYRVTLADGGWMLIDGGVDTDAAWTALDAGIQESGGWAELRLHLVTHMHVDHYGLARRVAEKAGAPVAMGVLDAERATHAARDAADEATYRDELLRSSGVPSEIRAAVRQLASAGAALAPFVPIDHPIRIDDQRVPFAPEWAAVWTPGHTAGHMVLFRERDRTLIAGDHVLPTISPTIGVNRQRADPVSDYLASLEDMIALRPRAVLGGHGEPMNGADRIHELAEEALTESERVRVLLGKEPASAWEVAGRRYAGRDLPVGPRLQSVRETLAHLDRLVARGEAASAVDDHGVVGYFR